MARTYARVVGVVVLLTGIIGLFIGEGHALLGFNVDLVEDIIHIVSGGLLTYVGFAGTAAATRSPVMGLGAVYLLVGIIGFIAPSIYGLIPGEMHLQDNLLHLALGALGLMAAMSSARETTGAGTTTA